MKVLHRTSARLMKSCFSAHLTFMTVMLTAEMSRKFPSCSFGATAFRTFKPYNELRRMTGSF